MSAKKKWTDVRLLSFDLQTVEFAYAEDYTVSITCTDQLALGGGTYELRFSRATEEANTMDIDSDDVDTILAQYNPHEDIEPFMLTILRSGPLSLSLTRVVAMLRETLPVVAELEYIHVSAQKAGENIDTFAKTAGWYRVLYGDYR
jgi:mediator of RNA polymerase II transcription subunit 14